jgi:7-carboxy-7-deazaguanine synthase
MKIAELFYSIQGEGALTGVPSFFIRLHGCNLHCSWCDTPYASRDDEQYAQDMSCAEIIDELRKYPAANHAVITGGEPLLAPQLPELTHLLRDISCHITIETNGTIPPGETLCDLASISPKLRHSGNPVTRNSPIHIDALRQWFDVTDTQLKFVVQSPEDITEIQAILHRLDRPVRSEKILLMPQTQSTASINWIIDCCKANGYRYCHRLQYTLFGNKKGT